MLDCEAAEPVILFCFNFANISWEWTVQCSPFCCAVLPSPFSLLPLWPHGLSSKRIEPGGVGGGGKGRGPGYMATLDRLHLVLRSTSKYFGLYHVAVVLSFLRSKISLAVI